MKNIFAYTDGSASLIDRKYNGPGGFGTYFPDLYGKKKAFSLGFEKTKTGRMEVMALYYAINAIDKFEETHLIVYSDSEYVVKTFTEKRLQKWIMQNFYGKKNVDLWRKIVKLLRERPNMVLTMRHIRSHQVEKEKDPEKKAELMENKHIIGNMMADKLADYKRHKILLKSDKL